MARRHRGRARRRVGAKCCSPVKTVRDPSRRNPVDPSAAPTAGSTDEMSDGTKIALFLGGLLVLGGLGYGLYRFSQKHPHRYLPTATSPGVPQLPAAGASGVTVTTTTAS